MTVRVFVMTHKEFNEPDDSVYVPLHVGRKSYMEKVEREFCEKVASCVKVSCDEGLCGENLRLLSYIGDDTGDNISDKNCYYSELTGLYWVWKNVKDVDIVGSCHYRRYLINSLGKVLTSQEISQILQSYDLITTKNLQLNYSYYDGFSHNHKQYYLDETEKVIKELYPEDYPVYLKMVHEKHTYFGNMIIARKEIYDEYMEWLFSILQTLEQRIVIEEEDSYHRRIFGFISEFLLLVWVTCRKKSVYECMVGMLGEKAETAEIKRTLGEYFAKGDFEGAKEFFLEARKKRPDILMEASDITGELHLCMQIIATAGLEQQTYGSNLLDKMRDYRELMHWCNELNRYSIGILRGEDVTELSLWVETQGITEVAKKVSLEMFRNCSEQAEYIGKF